MKQPKTNLTEMKKKIHLSLTSQFSFSGTFFFIQNITTVSNKANLRLQLTWGPVLESPVT